MPIDLNPMMEAVMNFLNQCAFSADEPIHACISESYCYDAKCFTYGMLFTVLAIIWLIIKWRGIR